MSPTFCTGSAHGMRSVASIKSVERPNAGTPNVGTSSYVSELAGPSPFPYECKAGYP